MEQHNMVQRHSVTSLMDYNRSAIDAGKLFSQLAVITFLAIWCDSVYGVQRALYVGIHNCIAYNLPNRVIRLQRCSLV